MNEALALLGLATEDIAGFFDAAQEAADQTGVGFIVAVADDSALLRLIHASRGAAQILGHSPEELRGKPFHELLPPDELERIAAIVRERNRGGASAALYPTVVLRKDGTRVPIEVGTNRVRIGERNLALIFIHDISERLKQEEDLRRSEARFRTLIEHAPDGVAILFGRAIAYVNPTAAEMLGFSSQEAALGADIGSLLIPEHVQKAYDRISETMRTGRALQPGTEYTVRSSGRTCEIVSVPIDFEGAPAIIGFARDITDRKALHERLARSDRLATIGALAGGIAHEINNPLACVQMALESLERQAVGSAADTIAEAKRSVARIERIVGNLRGSVISDTKARAPLEIGAVIERAIKLCENEIRHRATLIRAYAAAPLVMANEAELEQLFLNLLVNAAQSFADSNLDRNQIRVALERSSQGGASIEVADTGAGIASDIAERIFDPFFTTKPPGVGTGLGLTIARQIVHELRGSIDVDSEVGRGTIVRVLLPAASGEPIRESKERRAILLIDDEPVIRLLFTKLIEPIHDIITADSAQAALAILEKRSDFDAILCDLMMPGTNGRQLYETISVRWPGLVARIAFITGGVFDPVLTQFLAEVPNPKLLKPFLLADVLRTVEQIAER